MSPPMSQPLAPSAATDRLDAALALAERGFAVFPLRPDSKVPAVRGDWEGLAIADPARLRELGWPPGGNIGIACGPSGLFVLDLDVAKEPGPGPVPEADEDDEPRDGVTVLRELAAGRSIPPTLTVATPSGGTHLYFRPQTTLRLRNTVARLGPLIDTRASGGYVVAPGSVIGGRPYEIVEDAPIAPIPRWIVRELINRGRAALPQFPAVRPGVAGPRPPGAAAAAYGAAALRNETERMLAAPVGTRNDTLNRAAYALGRLIGAGILDRDLAASELFHAARRAGLPARECASTLASGLGAGMARPRFPLRRRPAVVAMRTLTAPPADNADRDVTYGGARSIDAAHAHDANDAPPHVHDPRSGDDPVAAAPPEPAHPGSVHPDRSHAGLSDPIAAQLESGRPGRDIAVISALRAVDRSYDAAALCAAPLVLSRDWRRIRALVDALRDLRDAPRPGPAEARRATALCEAIRDLAGTLARDFPAPGRKRARSPLGNALRSLSRSAATAAEALAGPAVSGIVSADA
jgi:hypothetical protein